MCRGGDDAAGALGAAGSAEAVGVREARRVGTRCAELEGERDLLVLERVFYAPGQAHYRVTRASLDAFRELLEQGLTIAAARAVMWRFRERGELPPADLDRERMDHIYWMSRQRRRW